jgi:DNA-binding GntR family transcriptional regulator
MHVAKLSIAEYLEIAHIRHSLDLLAVDAILGCPDGRLMAKLDAHWENFAAVENDPDPLVRYESHVAFHRGIWETSENQVLLRLWPVIEAHIALVQDQALRSDPVRDIQQHHALIEALRSRDWSAIEKTFWKHTIGSAQEFVAIVEARGQ